MIHKNNDDVSKRGSNQIELRAGSLLLIKPVGAKMQPMVTSKFNAQLSDIYTTILDHYGLDHSDRSGVSLGTPKFQDLENIREQIFLRR